LLVGHVDLNAVSFFLPDGRVLLRDVTFRVGDGAKVALVGANGAGKTTLLRIVSGDIDASDGAVTRSGGLGVMRQFVGSVRDDSTIRDLLVSVAPPAVRTAAAAMDRAEHAMMEQDDEPTQLRYAQALSDWADAGGYDAEVLWDTCTVAALGVPYERAQWRDVRTLSGGEQKRLVLEALLRGPDQVLLLDEPDNYLDVLTKRWLEEELRESPKTVLFVSHDRELLSRTATRVVTVELGAAGNTVWTHGGGFASYHQARRDRFSRLEELLRRWDEEHQKLRELMLMYKQKAAYNSKMAGRYQAAVTRLRMFEEAGPPEAVPIEQDVTMRLRGARTGKRAVVCGDLELTGLMKPFDLEVWFGDRVAVLGSNGSGKSHFLRLLAAGGSDPDVEHRPVDDVPIAPVSHTGSARLGARVRPGWFAQTHEHPELVGRTLLDILWRGDAHRAGMGREEASRALDRYELAHAAEQRFETLSGGQQARLQILLLELSGATLLLLDEPTDNLDLVSAEALEEGLEAFAGTVLAVTHDRWFARGFDRFLVFGADGRVYESDEPIWDEGRVERVR
jgi:ATPase subunit of ABC transporter with duplicated ATPase domains